MADALARAREIESRLDHFKSSGQGKRKLKHGELIDLYLDNLRRRADAGELAAVTVARYTTALQHYRDYAERPGVQRAFPFAAGVNRDFQLGFGSYLEQIQISPNGHARGRRRPLRSSQFVLDTTRAVFAWAADPNRGNLLPDGFHNPFLQHGDARRRPARDPFGEPDITVAMAVDFIGECDGFQLPLFAMLILYGLRAAEPAFLFREHVDGQWLRIVCMPELNYFTKGKRDKRFPTVAVIEELQSLNSGGGEGLLFKRRGVAKTDAGASLFGASLAAVVGEFQRRCASDRLQSAARRKQIRDEVLAAAGGLNYDHIEGEFTKIARRLRWPPKATLKDFRHLFSTCLENAGVPEYYRRYLMGQSPGRATIATYTHLNELKTQFQKALRQDLAPLVEALERRAGELAQGMVVSS